MTVPLYIKLPEEPPLAARKFMILLKLSFMFTLIEDWLVCLRCGLIDFTLMWMNLDK